jgi:MerR family transcriptional regulator, light-induced transcriptional regulator
MGKYSIKEIEVLSGVKAHTLRIWEQRYHLVVPERTNTNIRYYTDQQLKQILNIALLNKHGYKISKIVNLSEDEIVDKVRELQESDSPHDSYINPMINAMIHLDRDEFSQSIEKALKVYSFEKFCADIVFPFLKRTGILWVSGSITPAQEHFASNILKRKVICEIEKLDKRPREGAKKFLLFLPEGEFHELSLLISEYILLNNGHKTYYFGASLPLGDLNEVLKSIDVDYLFCVMLVSKSMEEIKSDIQALQKLAGKSKVIIAGSAEFIGSVKLPKTFIGIQSIDNFVELVKGF